MTLSSPVSVAESSVQGTRWATVVSLSGSDPPRGQQVMAGLGELTAGGKDPSGPTPLNASVPLLQAACYSQCRHLVLHYPVPPIPLKMIRVNIFGSSFQSCLKGGE